MVSVLAFLVAVLAFAADQSFLHVRQFEDSPHSRYFDHCVHSCSIEALWREGWSRSADGLAYLDFLDLVVHRDQLSSWLVDRHSIWRYKYA